MSTRGEEDGHMEGDDVMQFELSDDTPVYVISVAAQLSGLHPQTLRAYDRLGLVSPGRAVGRGRRYSLRDILALREVQRLSQEEGINLLGIKRILELEDQEQRSRMLLAEMHAEINQLRAELESTRAVAARLAGLLRSRNSSAALVPVRPSDVSVTAQPSGRAARPSEGQAEAAALGHTAKLRETNDG
jgi:MerR family transcriptional regulator, heat shock protein HspR